LLRLRASASPASPDLADAGSASGPGNIFVRDLSTGSLDQVMVPINDGVSDLNNAPTAITDDGCARRMVRAPWQ
jgi:hypothetical protein